KPVCQMATIAQGAYCSAQGPVIKKHANGEVTINSSLKMVRGMPVNSVQSLKLVGDAVGA
ncbi:MAG: hypothetical protein ABJN42_10570, partial [Roseibium sp.]